ncbi:MAG: hypothetical protein ACYDH9_20060 [Limisphaerales bacterium]
MTARDVIEQIKTLPPEEKAVVMDFLRQLEGAADQPPSVGHVDRSKLESSAKQVFKRYDGLFRKLAK